jgi:hypothetical protein
MLDTLPRPIDPLSYTLSATIPDLCNNCGHGVMIRTGNKRDPKGTLMCSSMCGNRWYPPYDPKTEKERTMPAGQPVVKIIVYGWGRCVYRHCKQRFSKKSPNQTGCCRAHTDAEHRIRTRETQTI